MNTFVITITAASLFTMGNLSFADQCPDTLNAEQMYDCIVVEGAGGTYEGQGKESQTEAAGTVDSADKQSRQQAKTSAKPDKGDSPI